MKEIVSPDDYREMNTTPGIYQEIVRMLVGTHAENLKENVLNSRLFKIQNFIANMPKYTILKSGDCFGEGALLNSSKTRQATIRCETDCYFGILSQDSFKTTVALIQQSLVSKKVDLIMSCQHFAKESRQIFENHHYYFKRMVVTKGAVLTKQG